MKQIFTQLLLRTLPTSFVHKAMQRQNKDYQSFKEEFFSAEPQLIQLLQEKYLLYSFHLNASRIPHYKKFLKENKIEHTTIKTKEDFLTRVPETNKQNYVYKVKDLVEMCIDGDYHNINMIVKSSGHSGKQCYWAKSHQEDSFGKNALSIILDENFQVHKRKTLIINGFILGSWVTGINFFEFASWHCPIINVGPDKDEILQTMKDIGRNYEQIIITGYPPFIKDLVDYANGYNFIWKQYRVHFIAGGEDFPESWREYITKNAAGAIVRSGFGASDIGILGGMENDDTIFIRRLADKNHEFRKALFGVVDETPMLFQYPLNLYIYANEQQELVFTTILPEATQPVIKYNLQDIGGTFKYHEMAAVLEKFGIQRKVHLPLPYLYIVGRKSGSVKFNAFMIYPENIEECIYRNSLIAKTCTGSFKFKTTFDQDFNRKLHIEFQLKEKMKKTETLEKEYLNLVYKTLREVNEGYRASCKKLGDLALPKVVLYSFEKYPYVFKIKNRYN